MYEFKYFACGQVKNMTNFVGILYRVKLINSRSYLVNVAHQICNGRPPAKLNSPNLGLSNTVLRIKCVDKAAIGRQTVLEMIQ